MYCKKCGRKFKEDKNYCSYCGQGQEDIVLTGDEKKDAVAQTNYKTIGGVCIIISCILPLIGFLMSIIYLCTMKNNTTMDGKEEGKKRFIISIIISVAWLVVPVLIGIGKLIISSFK